MPTAFVSYSWDSDMHRTWVRELSRRLRSVGVETVLDQWEVAPGDDLAHFMERAIRENDHVVVVCTPDYKRKSDNREGGVGWEGGIMAAEAFVIRNRRKFIPVLRTGEWPSASPSWLLGSYYVDMRGAAWENLDLLVDTLHHRLPEPPPVRAQGFKILPDKSVLDATTSLVWSNCRMTELVDLRDLESQILERRQQSGWDWRLPTTEEVAEVEEAEEYYARPPIMVKLQGSHPFFGPYQKCPWTDEIVGNVRQADQAKNQPFFNANGAAAVWSGLARALNVDSYHVASEANRLGRQFLLRLVRAATDEDFASATSDHAT